jgi:hypothetical protein
LGFGCGVLGFGDWAQTPNPKSPIPNPQSPNHFQNIIKFKNNYLNKTLKYILEYNYNTFLILLNK